MKKPLTFAVLGLLVLTGCGAHQTAEEPANSETNTANPFEQTSAESSEATEEPSATSSSSSGAARSSSAGSGMDELSALLEEDPQVPESASAEDKKVLEPLMKTYDELNEQGLKMSDNNPDPILEFVDNLVADVDNGIKAKGEQPGSDVITYTDLYAFLASNTGEKKLDLKGYNGEALKHLPLREYIYYSPEMSDIEVAAFNFYWGELMAYTYSADEEGNPSDRFYTDPVLIEGKYQVVDSN